MKLVSMMCVHIGQDENNELSERFLRKEAAEVICIDCSPSDRSAFYF